MEHIGTAKINVDPDLARLTLVMRVLAKHLTACADELSEVASGTSRPIKVWSADQAVENGGE